VSEHEGQSEEYRRGYHAGFIQGVESLLSLARPDARRRALAGALLVAFAACYDFWRGDLGDWTKASEGQPAPELWRP